MKCPVCGHLESSVIDSRATLDGYSIRRRRVCDKDAKHRWTTYEIEMSLPRGQSSNKQRLGVVAGRRIMDGVYDEI